MPECPSELREAPGTPPRRTWPQRFPPSPAERIELRCVACGGDWWIHFDLAGYRLRCGCGSWLRVPPDPRVPASLRAAALARLPRGGAAARARLAPPAGISLAASSAPPIAPTRSVSPAVPRPRARRKGWQLAGLTALLAAPGLALPLAADGAPLALFQPLVALLAGLVVLATGLFSDRATAAGLRGSAPRFLAEGVVAAFAGAALVAGWSGWLGGGEALTWPASLREELGYPLALLLGAAVPAVFEELAFRGLLQGRASRLVGRRGGVMIGAAAFALAHGLGPALPVFALLGLHLGSLRARSRSLLPCVLEHFLFAGLCVLLL